MNAQLLQALVNEDRPINITLTLSDLREVVRTLVHDERRRIKKESEENHQKPTLTKKDAASFLGVSESTLNRLCSDHQITAYKVGNAVRFKQCDLESFLETNKKVIR